MKTMEAEFQKDKEFLQFKEQVPEFTREGYGPMSINSTN